MSVYDYEDGSVYESELDDRDLCPKWWRPYEHEAEDEVEDEDEEVGE